MVEYKYLGSLLVYSRSYLITTKIYSNLVIIDFILIY